jgi:uncharacterized protein YcbX
VTSPVVSGLFVYPIKSCRAVALDTAVVTPLGPQGDRTWQVVTDDGREINQRKHPVLATVQPELRPDGGLCITAPGMAALDVGAPGDASTTTRSHFGTAVPAWDAGASAAAWFSELVGLPLRLVAMVDATGWRLPGELDMFQQSAAFTDAAPALVTCEASLNWLRERSAEDFGMERFRPNIVVSGTEPWAEDAWATFTVGEAELRTGLPWPRCAIPQVDQRTGERCSEPAKVLRSHRWCTSAPALSATLRAVVEGNALFGFGCAIGPVGAAVRLGDAVTVHTTAPPVLPMG